MLTGATVQTPAGSAELSPASGVSLPPAGVTKAHTRRLRYYAGISHPVVKGDMTDLDLEVMGMITVDRTGKYHGNKIELTDCGRQAIYEDRQAIIAAQGPHHALASRIAAWLRSGSRITWENIELKAEFGPNDFCYVRPDVFSIVPTYEHSRLVPLIHEIKVTRADFMAELAKPRKLAAYKHLAGSVFYVAPEGILTPEDIPDDCGLVVERSSGEFIKVKNVRSKKFQLSSRSLIKLVLTSYGQVK